MREDSEAGPGKAGKCESIFERGCNGDSLDLCRGHAVPGDPSTPAPEPGSLLLPGTGLGAMGLAVWRKRK